MAELPLGLKELVGQALELLGKAIELEYGQKTFGVVEEIRQSFKEVREADLASMLKVHHENIEKIRELDRGVRYQVAHAFAISLELINACENAYRSFRLKGKKLVDHEAYEDRITFVLTAHPTESRSPECIVLFTRLTYFFIKVFEGEVEVSDPEVFHLVLLFLKTSVARNKKPEVADEAEYIYSISLRKEMIESLIAVLRNGETVFLRTWVGGDKDGHPGVNEHVMKQSLTLSRKRLLDFAELCLMNTLVDLRLLPKQYSSKIEKKIQIEIKKLNSLKQLLKDDGKRVALFHKSLAELENEYLLSIKAESPHLRDLKQLLYLFPGLVVPLELRDSSTLIREAQAKATGTIWKMLAEIRKISAGANPRWYARALVVSTTESAADILVAARFVQSCLGSLQIPVIPLFESEHSLKGARAIVEELLLDKKFIKTCEREWDSRFEVMLGYSDSAKESGSLASRMMIHEALFDLEKCIQDKKLVPVFFHGSGGSVARGGGSLEEQVSWWPLSSRKIFKVTIQGEMVYRSFAMPEIFKSQVQKTLQNSKYIAEKNEKEQHLDQIKIFSEKVAQEYRRLVAEPDFLRLVEKSTPYTYLSDLNIGSRPTKRSKGLSLTSLRAIPWVLCWTQMRSLLPIWWGLGTIWRTSTDSEKAKLQTSFQESKFFSSFVKLLSFSLAKVDLSVWFTYLQHSELEDEIKNKYQKLFEDEFNAAVQFAKEVSGKNDLLWFRPWLETSIRLRSTMIHPLNLAQLVALESSDHALLRETVTGVASGMLTTG